MLLLGHLAKVQGLKGEFLLHVLMDDPDRLPAIQGLVLAPPDQDLESATDLVPPARPALVRGFRWHQDRPCLALFSHDGDNAWGGGYMFAGPVSRK